MRATKPTTTVRVPTALLGQVEKIADVNQRTLMAEVTVALEDYVRRNRRGAAQRAKARERLIAS